MTATEALERRIDELCAENERLRSCLSDDADNAREIMAENKRLRQDNDGLRELVRDMCEWAYIDSCCNLQGEFADRMRELGVEVDG